MEFEHKGPALQLAAWIPAAKRLGPATKVSVFKTPSHRPPSVRAAHARHYTESNLSFPHFHQTACQGLPHPCSLPLVLSLHAWAAWVHLLCFFLRRHVQTGFKTQAMLLQSWPWTSSSQRNIWPHLVPLKLLFSASLTFICVDTVVQLWPWFSLHKVERVMWAIFGWG